MQRFIFFRLPPAWKPYLCFNLLSQGEDCGGVPGATYALCCNVIPMGWLNSVGIMQEISENLLKQGCLNPRNQIARGHALPPWLSAILVEAKQLDKAWWHIYLDNFCAGERTWPGDASKWGELCHEQAELCWKSAGVVSSEKKRISAGKIITELGAEVDGIHGTLGISTEKLTRLCVGTLWLIQQPRLIRKFVQVMAGRWVFVLQFRRPGMSFLQHTWKFIGGKCSASKKLVNLVKGEFFSLVCAASTLQCNLGAGISKVVVASDASEKGGAIGVAEQLSLEGLDFVTAERKGELAGEGVAPILLISLFNGIGGTFRSYDIVGITPTGRIAVELNDAANRITQRRWPGVVVVKDVREVTREVVRSWSLQFLRIEEIHLWGGFPCVDLSGVKHGRANLRGEHSSLFWEIPRIAHLLEEEFGNHVVVKQVIENVASMDREAAAEISEAFGSLPYKLDPVTAVPMRRPRFCWTTENIEGVFPDITVEFQPHWKEIHAHAPYPIQEDWVETGFIWNGGLIGDALPTAMKSIPRKQPPPKPAGLEKCDADTVSRWREDSYRYPPLPVF